MDGSATSAVDANANDAIDVAANEVASTAADEANGGEQKMSIAAAVAAIDGESAVQTNNGEGGHMPQQPPLPTGTNEESLSVPTSPSSQQRTSKFLELETPMWRFVAKAKKTEGYSSGHAGTVVKGISAHDLASKYKAPELEEAKKDDGEVIHIGTMLDNNVELEKEGRQVGKLDLSSDNLESKEKELRQVGKFDLAGLDGHAVDEKIEYASLQNIDNERKQGGVDNVEKEDCPGQSPADEEEVVSEDEAKQHSSTEDHQDTEEESQLASTTERDDLEISIVEASPAATDDKRLDQVEKQQLNDEALSNPNEEISSPNRNKRWALLLLLLLAVIAIILGLILSRSDDNSDEANEANGSDIQEVNEDINILFDGPTNVTEMSDPTNSPTHSAPTQSPTTYCPENAKLFSVKHTRQSGDSLFSVNNVTNTWVVFDACSREEILRCLPCPDRLTQAEITRLRGENLRQRRRSLQGNNIGPAKYLASSDGLSACIPDTLEYVFELRQNEGECCGFDPDSFVMTYDDTAVIQQKDTETLFANGSTDTDELVGGKAHFASENTEPCPSQMPSFMPSDMPTHSTKAPTMSPTSSPTKTPTPQPSAQPTTSEPTLGPSLSPSLSPTKEPSPSPSQKPSPPPSLSPSKEPSASPSQKPTPSPIMKPVTPAPTTPRPTPRPTPLPTLEPTAKPTCNSRSDEDFNICFAIDMSGSVCNQGSGYECDLCEPELICKSVDVDKGTCCNNFADMIDFSKLIVSTLEAEILADKSYTVVGFGNSAALSSDLASRGETLNALDELTYLGGRTNHAEAINVCRSSLLGSSDNRKNLILLITDGDPSEPQGTPQADAEQAADAAKLDGISIIPVMIVPQFTTIIKAPLEYLKGISSDGVVFDVSDFNLLDSLRTSLLEQVSCRV